jgi:phage gp29-like protein
MAESGDMRAVADLCTTIMGSPRAGADLRTRRLAITGAPVEFDKAAKGRLARRALNSASAEEDWFYMVPEEEQEMALQWRWMLGLTLARLEWWEDNPAASTPEQARDLPKVARIRNGRNVPRLTVWNPRCLRYDWPSRLWFVRLDDGTEEPITDGMNGWILWTSSRLRPWLNGLWRGLAPMFLLIGFALQDWRDQSEKFAQGVAVLTGPAAHDDEFRVKLVDDWRNAGARGAVYLPENTELKIFELTANNWETFEAQIRLAQTSITISILGSNLPTEVSSSGAGTGATAQQEVRQDIKSGDARMWETFGHVSVMRPWAKANYLTPDVAPWITVKVEPPEDEKQFAEAAEKAALAMQNLEELQAPYDRIAFMQKAGIPVDDRRVNEARRAKVQAWQVTSGTLTLNQARIGLGWDPEPGRDIYYQPPANSQAEDKAS